MGNVCISGLSDGNINLIIKSNSMSHDSGGDIT